MWRSLLRAAVNTTRNHRLSNITSTIPIPILATISTTSSANETSNLLLWRLYSMKAKPPKSMPVKSKKKPKHFGKSEDAEGGGGGSAAEMDADLEGEEQRLQMLEEDEKDKSLDVGPNGVPLFTSAASLSELTSKDTCSYMKFKLEELNAVLPEGLPIGMVKEFEDSKRNALLIRQSFLDLRDNFRRVVNPSSRSSFDGKGKATEGLRGTKDVMGG